MQRFNGWEPRFYPPYDKTIEDSFESWFCRVCEEHGETSRRWSTRGWAKRHWLSCQHNPGGGDYPTPEEIRKARLRQKMEKKKARKRIEVQRQKKRQDAEKERKNRLNRGRKESRTNQSPRSFQFSGPC